MTSTAAEVKAGAVSRIGKIVRSADFQRVLATISCARSIHFAVHHVPDHPSSAKLPRAVLERKELSTKEAPPRVESVDNTAKSGLPSAIWLGAVVPKRHARRSVTRSLIKRQIRAAVEAQQQCQPALPGGLWVVRLRAPFDRKIFTSAVSPALRQAAHSEIRSLMQQAAIRATVLARNVPAVASATATAAAGK